MRWYILLLALSATAFAASWTVTNPTGQTYVNEAIRLHLPVPVGPFTVKQDGVAVPYQTETVDGKPFIWALISMKKGERHEFATEPGAPVKGPQTVKLTREGACWVLDNGQIAAKVPAEAATLVPPMQSVRLPDGRWVGQGSWVTGLKLKRFSSTVLGDGQVFAKVRLRYDFDALVGVDGKTPAFAEIDVALYPGQRHLVIEDRHEMGRDDAWEFDLCAGWHARTPMLEVFGGGAGRPKNPAALPKDLTPLGWDRAALQKRYDTGDPRLGDTLMWLIPRANQHYEDGWLFAVTDGTLAAGAIPARAGRWWWPNDNKIDVRLKATADYAGLRCPMRHGSRYWYLVVGEQGDFATARAASYALRYVYQGLDKILIDYITTWPGKDDQQGFYAGPFNPIGLGRGFLPGGGGPGNTPMDKLTALQVGLDPDMYGEYWQFMSPENPNFFTSFYGSLGPGLLPSLEGHPRYADLKRLVATKVAEDIYHSFTLPSGAGQECPGYMSVGGLSKFVKLCADYPFGKEMQQRLDAALRFKRRVSYPDGDFRRNSPMGDSHPDRAGKTGMSRADVPADEVKSWKTEELQGYGVVFTNNPGTPRETYLAFKSGPNRGHYHGDQLAFHYCANATPTAVDHHCSYNPRAGQEHMHNRLAFFTDDFPYANMDGYERLIAFKPGDGVDIAMGQVESNRLRLVQRVPPEDWDRDYPRLTFDTPLVYRRTMVCVKGGAQDYFVIRDQYQADRPLKAAYCLHVDADLQGDNDVMREDGPFVRFSNGARQVLTLFRAAPTAAKFVPFPWSHENGGHESTQGARLETEGVSGEYITVLYPGADVPPMAAIPGGVTVGGDEITFAGGIDQAAGTTYVTVKHGAVTTLTGKDIDLERNQGNIGLFVPNTGYPFGDIPDWLIRQRQTPPAWYQPVLPLGYRQE